MSSGYNARLLPLRDPALLARELESSSISPAELARLTQGSTAYAILLERAGAADAHVVVNALRSIGGEGTFLDEEVAPRVILKSTSEQLATVASKVENGAEEICREALVALNALDAPRGTTRAGDTVFEWGARTYVMGIVNVTPDSFSGDAIGDDLDAALALAERFVAEGADIIDVGGESTRPGSERIEVDEELRRVVPVVARLARELPVPVSIDTYKAPVAERCLDAGATMVNDIWGLLADDGMAELVSKRRVPVVMMHNHHGIRYANLMGEIIAQLRRSMEIARQAGVSEDMMIVDPGVGFGKSKEQNLELLHRLDELRVLGRPLLLGTSRKSTIGYVLGLPADQRVEGTAATVALGIAQGADIVRVHDVCEMVRVCRMADAVVRWRPERGGEEQWAGQTG